MKAIQIFSVMSFLVLAFTYQSCDKIEEPFLIATDTLGNGNDPGTDDVRKVLLEDYTGHTCVNCPEAAEEVSSLLAIHGERLIVVSVHSGVFAAPSVAPFTYDFRTPEGNTLHDYYQLQSYPSGMVDRTPSQGSTVLGKDKWATAVQNRMELPQQASIEITSTYDTVTRELDLTLETRFLENLIGTYYISAYITEDHIFKPQLGKEGVIQNFEHNHVLRAAVNGTWGHPVGNDGSATTGLSHHNHYTFTLDPEWVDKNCEVVAFVYNADSPTREIIQAEKSGIVH